MSSEDVIELSSDNENRPLTENDKKHDLFYEELKWNSRDGRHSGYISDNSSSLDTYFTCDIDDKVNNCVKSHDISSSDDSTGVETASEVASQQIHENTDLSDKCYDLVGNQSSQSSGYACSQNSSKEFRAAERERKRLEREKLKELKQKERDEKKKQREQNLRDKFQEKQIKKQNAFRRNQMKPNLCLQYMTVVIDEKLYRTVLCSKVIEMFPHREVQFKCQKQIIDNSISWQRTQVDGSIEEEDWVCIMWTAEQLAQSIKDSTLVPTFCNIKTNIFPNKTIVLFIFTLELYYRKSQNSKCSKKSKKNPDEQTECESPGRDTYLTKEEIELGLVELQILSNVSHRKFEDSNEFTDLLAQFTKAVAQIPYKREKEQVDKEMGWYSKLSSKNCIRINKDMQGLDRLWIQHLSVYSNTNVDTAKAVAALYPTPTALIQAYENCSSQKEKESLLQNIQIVRSGSTSAAVKRIGPELSRKICLTFTETNPDVKLSNKK